MKPKEVISTGLTLQGLTLSWFSLKIPDTATKSQLQLDADHVEHSRTLILLKWSSPWLRKWSSLQLLKWSSPRLLKWSSPTHLIRTSTLASELNLQLDSIGLANQLQQNEFHLMRAYCLKGTAWPICWFWCHSVHLVTHDLLDPQPIYDYYILAPNQTLCAKVSIKSR